MTPSADESARIMTEHLLRHEPFSYFRYGDGFLELQMGKRGRTCDGEDYTPELARDLIGCWTATLSASHLRLMKCYIGDWQTASFVGPEDASRYIDEWAALLGNGYPRFLHPEALLFMRESQELAAFYQALRADKRRKLYMGPLGNMEPADWLGCEHLGTPMRGMHGGVRLISLELERKSPDILLFGAGLAGMIPAVRSWEAHPDRTFIHLGSALDPLGRGKSRKQQLTREQCWRLLGNEPR